MADAASSVYSGVVLGVVLDGDSDNELTRFGGARPTPASPELRQELGAGVLKTETGATITANVKCSLEGMAEQEGQSELRRLTVKVQALLPQDDQGCARMLARIAQLQERQCDMLNSLPDQVLLATLQKPAGAGAAAAAGGGVTLTAKVYVEQQLPQLKHWLPETASSARTKARTKQTFAGLQPWEGFQDEVENFTRGLDDTDARLMPLVFPNTRMVDGTRMSDLEYAGGGSGRCLSNTDLLLRHKGTTCIGAASRLILAPVEVKGKWQMNLTGSNNMLDVLEDSKKGAMAVGVIQQAYGDAVMDEAPLLIISNYDVTYFIKRDVQDVANKVLFVSPPVSWNSRSPYPLASWLFCLHHASSLWDEGIKTRLPHAQVPVAPAAGYVNEGATYFLSRGGWGQEPQRQQPARGQHGSCKDNQQDSPRSGSQGGAQGLQLQQWQSLLQAGPLEALAALAVLPGSCLSYSDCVLSATSSSVVVKGTVCGLPAAIKIFTLEDEALTRFTQEVSMHLNLHQEPFIVPLLAVGLLPHTGRPVIALAEGQPLSKEVPDWHQQAREALHELHRAGWCHGDVSAGNMLLYNGRVVLCDLETCAPITEAGQQLDLGDWDSMLQ